MKKILLLFVMFVSINFMLSQTVVSGVTLPNKVVFDNSELSLNGAGIREKFWIDLYVGGLYLQTKMSDSRTVVDLDSPMVIKINIVSGLVSQKKMVNAINEGFSKTNFGRATNAQKKVFVKFFSDKINKGDVFDIVYSKGNTTVYKNNKNKGNIYGLEFKKALFGIWLGKKPVSKKLKSKMLGK